MVKSYTRFELEATFGIVSSASAVAHIPSSSKGPGRAVVGADEAVQVWDLKTSELMLRLVDPQQSAKAQVLQLSYEPQSELIAAGYSDGSIRVWDVRSASVLVTFNGHRSYVSALAFSTDGTQLVSASADTTVVVWDLVNEQGLYRLQGHKALISGVAVHPTLPTLITVSKDGIVKVWDVQTQFATETRVAHKGECWGVAWIDNDRLATVGSGTDLRIWQFESGAAEGSQLTSLGELQKQTRHRATGLLYDARSSTLLCSSGDAVQAWRKRTPEELKRALKRKQKRAQKGKNSDDVVDEIKLGAADEYIQVSLARTKAKIAGICCGAKQNDVIVNLASNSVECWSVNTEEGEREFVVERAGHRTDVRDAAISSDGSMVATGANGTIKVYNVRSQAVVRTLVDTGYVLALRFLPGDGLLVAATKEGAIDIYDLAKAIKLSGVVDAHAGAAVWSLDLSSDGKQLVSGGADKSVKFWSLEVVEEGVLGHPELPRVPRMTLKNTHKLEFNDDVLAVKLSPDMRFVAASLLDSTVKVYYRDSLKFFLNLYGHQLPVLSLDISHDSKLLVSSSADKNVKIWGLDFGDCHKSIFAHDDAVLRVVFEPHTHNFLSASKDGLVKYWDGIKFAQIQRLEGHHSEVWALAVAPDGAFAVTASHDKSVRLWEMTDEPLFIEEERERELEEQYEENLVEQLERDARDTAPTASAFDDDDGAPANEDKVGGVTSAVTKYSIESLKAGERIYEALEICLTDLEEHPNPRHVILAALDVSPEQYLMDVLSKVRTPIVEDALLTFPLDKIVGLLKFVMIWLDRRWNLPLVSRVLFFSLRTFHRQLVANKMLQPEFEEIRDKLRSQLTELSNTIGFNLAQMRWIQTMWNENHVKAFPGSEEEPASTKKRVYTTIHA